MEDNGLQSRLARAGDFNFDPGEPEHLREERRRMVADQIRYRGIGQERVLQAMRLVPRHRFVPPDCQGQAYADHPLPIGKGQTISQPYIVALMTESLAIQPPHRILEIGAGSGYQTAILACLAAEVFTIEIHPALLDGARLVWRELGFANIQSRAGDGYGGWPGQAPFDGIILTAAPRMVPPPLLEQLKTGGRLVAPVGESEQELVLFRKTDRRRVEEEPIVPVRFVPMVGRAGSLIE